MTKIKEVMAEYRLDAADDWPPEMRWWYHRTWEDPELFKSPEYRAFAHAAAWWWPHWHALQDACERDERRLAAESKYALELSVCEMGG